MESGETETNRRELRGTGEEGARVEVETVSSILKLIMTDYIAHYAIA